MGLPIKMKWRIVNVLVLSAILLTGCSNQGRQSSAYDNSFYENQGSTSAGLYEHNASTVITDGDSTPTSNDINATPAVIQTVTPTATPTLQPTLTPTPTVTPAPTPEVTPTPELTATQEPEPTDSADTSVTSGLAVEAEVTPTGIGQRSDSVVSTVTLLTLGDNILHQKNIDSGLQPDGTYNYDHFYALQADQIAAADIAVINQETTIGGEHYPYAGYPKFNSPTAIGDALVKAGFDVILQANNHITDYGTEGLLYTLDYWDTQPSINVLGIQRTVEEYNEITVIEKNGIKIAMLNYTYGLNVGTDGKYYMVDSLDKKKVIQDIEKAKETADFIIVFPHWGDEYVYEPNTQQLEYTQLFADMGVDLVVGMHPHVLQPVEWVEGKDGNLMLVYYSLGNYMASMDYTPRILNGMANVTIAMDESGNAYIQDADIIPLVTHYERGWPYNYAVYELSDYTEELAAKHYILFDKNHRGDDFSLALMKQLARQILGDWYIE